MRLSIETLRDVDDALQDMDVIDSIVASQLTRRGWLVTRTKKDPEKPADYWVTSVENPQGEWRPTPFACATIQSPHDVAAWLRNSKKMEIRNDHVVDIEDVGDFVTVVFPNEVSQLCPVEMRKLLALCSWAIYRKVGIENADCFNTSSNDGEFP